MVAQNDSEKAALALYVSLLDAWNRRDADGFAEPFAEGGTAIGFDGSQMHGRAAIAAALRGIFAHHATAAYVAKVREVRPLDASVVLVRAVAGMVLPGQSQLNAAANAVQSLVTVGEAGEARIALFQNTPAAFHGRPELAEGLTAELAAVLDAGRLVESSEPV